MSLFLNCIFVCMSFVYQVETLKRFRESSDADAIVYGEPTSATDLTDGAVELPEAPEGNGAVQCLLMPLKGTNAGLSINEATHVFLLDTGLHRGLEIQVGEKGRG